MYDNGLTRVYLKIVKENQQRKDRAGRTHEVDVPRFAKDVGIATLYIFGFLFCVLVPLVAVIWVIRYLFWEM